MVKRGATDAPSGSGALGARCRRAFRLLEVRFSTEMLSFGAA